MQQPLSQQDLPAPTWPVRISLQPAELRQLEGMAPEAGLPAHLQPIVPLGALFGVGLALAIVGRRTHASRRWLRRRRVRHG